VYIYKKITDASAALTNATGAKANASISEGAMEDGITWVTTERPPGRGRTSEARHLGLTMPVAGCLSMGRL